jgi:peptidoglycan/LPS O-acetylase OafA/YrhL
MTTGASAVGAQPRPELKSLTSLRFFAAFAVLVLHYRDHLGPLSDWIMKGVIGGQYGVTFFFVLSGFILTYRYGDWFEGGVTESRYWLFQRFRFARIYPVFVLGLLLDTPWHLAERARVGLLGEVGPTYWASWLINLIGLQAWVPSVPFSMFWNTPAWSVSAEFFFYATFPFVCSALGRWRPGRTGLVGAFLAAIAIGIAMYVGLIYLVTFVRPVASDTQYTLLAYTPLMRFSEFLCGCMTGRLFLACQFAVERPGIPMLRSAAGRNFVIAMCLLVVAWRVWSADYTGPSQWLWLADVSVKYAVFILPFSLLILAFASGRTWLTPLLEQRWLVTLGDASFALYIVHWSVLSFLKQGYLGRYHTPAVHALFLLATVAFSVLVYHGLETPARKWLRGKRIPAGMREPLPDGAGTVHHSGAAA